MIAQADITHTNTWLGRFRKVWLEDVPLRLHSRDIAQDGSPQWSDALRRRMTDTDRREQYGDVEDSTTRLRRAMKQIRNRSGFEYIVLHRVLTTGESVDSVAVWLNDRAAEAGRSDRYTPAQVAVIVYAAVDKLYTWY